MKASVGDSGVKVVDDPVAAKLRTESYENLRPAILASGGNNVYAQHVLKKMSEMIEKARAEYFSRPVVTLPFVVSGDSLKKLASMHPELREINFMGGKNKPDEVFQAIKYLAVRRTLVKLFKTYERLREVPTEYQLLLDGVDTYDHQFMYRTKVTTVQLGPQWVDTPAKALMIADLCKSRYSFRELCSIAKKLEAYEALFVVPYVREMWTKKGGTTDYGYTFEWTFMESTAGKSDLRVFDLPSDFFTSEKKYGAYKLYVQAYNSSQAFVLEKRDFMSLFYTEVDESTYVEVRQVRNGFAEVSVIGFMESEFSLDPVVREVEMVPPPPRGMMQLVSPTTPIGSRVFGLSRDLALSSPVYMKLQDYRRGEKHLLSMNTRREAQNAVLRTLFAYSASIVRDGAILRVEKMLHPEIIAMATENLLVRTRSVRRLMSAMNEEVRMDPGADWKTSLSAFVRWAVQRAVTSNDLPSAIEQVVGFVRGSYSANLICEAPVAIMKFTRTIADDKRVEVDAIADYISDIMGPVPVSGFEFRRSEVSISRDQYDWLRIELNSRKKVVSTLSEAQVLYAKSEADINRLYSKYDTGVDDLQLAYDEVMPGISLVDPTMRQLQNEMEPSSFILDTAWFSCSIPAMFSVLDGYKVIPSQLRTSIGADHLSSFRQMMASLIKRNFNRPRPEVAGDRAMFAKSVVRDVLKQYGRSDYEDVLGMYALQPIVASKEAVEVWAEKHTVADVVAASALLDAKVFPDGRYYQLMPKSTGKAYCSTEAAALLTVGQTVVFHTKDIIALTVGMFTLALTRLTALFNDNIIFATASDEHSSGKWADKYLGMGIIYEFDIPKYDKSQDWTCFELVLSVLQLMGVSSELLEYWRQASDYGHVASSTFTIAFESLMGNKSGNGGTLPINCMVLLFAMLYSLQRAGKRVIAVIIKGDDMVIILADEISMSFYEFMEALFGLTTKPVQVTGGVIAFCSSFFCKDSFDSYILVRDPLRLLEKLGKALPIEKPSVFFLDYYAALVDATLPYSDAVVVANLERAVAVRYGKVMDVTSIVQFLKYITSDVCIFLEELYGLSRKHLRALDQIDIAAEILVRSRSGKFMKAKDLADRFGVVRKTLMDSSRMLQSYWFDV